MMSNKGLIYERCRLLALGVIVEAVLDAVRHGDEGAQDWINTQWFERWCDRCDQNPARWRRRVAELLASGEIISFELDDEVDIDAAVRLYEEGYTWGEVAEELGVDVKVLREKRKAAGYGVGNKTREVVDVDVAAAERLHRRGYTWMEIADEFNVSVGTLLNRRRAYGSM